MHTRYISEVYSGSLVLVSVITLWSATKSFVEGLQKDDNWSHVREKFESLKVLSAMINTTFGTVITCYLVCDILYYSVYLVSDFVDKESVLGDLRWSALMGMIFYFVHDIIVGGLACDICHQVRVKLIR